MSISDEAVEAAAKNIERITESWLYPVVGDNAETIAREALEAAAPHLMAQAWDEGAEAMCDEAVPECDYARNPYRSSGPVLNSGVQLCLECIKNECKEHYPNRYPR